MAQQQSNSAPRRRRGQTKRSRTGCRTCRIRHLKCDETPGGCRNCFSKGFTCEGSDVDRLPNRAAASQGPWALQFNSMTTEFCWTMTTDERRCLSFFLHRTIPNLISVYETSLWKGLVIRLSAAEPAVYHAVVALSAVNQDVEKLGVGLPGQGIRSPWHRFALEQSVRSFGLLKKRPGSQDPQLRLVMLVCCMLFILRALASGQYDEANAHLQSGLRIIKEMRLDGLTTASAFPVENTLLEAFLHLESQSSFHGVHVPILHLDAQLIYYGSYETSFLMPFRNLRDAQEALRPLVNTCFRFLEDCWSLQTEAELLRDYGLLQPKQQRLLSCLNQYGNFLIAFRGGARYVQLAEQEQRALDMMRLMQLTLTLALKSCLHTPYHPSLEPLIPEFEYLLAEAVAAIDKFPERPLVLVDTAVCPPLFVVASRCPDYSLRWQAIHALRDWPHCEGYLNSVLIAELLVAGMKAELARTATLGFGLFPRYIETGGMPTQMGHPAEHASDEASFLLEENQTLRDAVASLQCASYWPCIKATGLVEQAGDSSGADTAWSGLAFDDTVNCPSEPTM
ncbi:hypothetical protein BDV40DRAFT_59272 [Aspergillus tamarii]|uniref:Zn(2)-C6 fungal-type domain-containing protein n=1 Tax=Aspergillus tamarii TaxID=41984 RepID=A0A5N6V457_ASPTM|nr:hypothetical protein BDV40DRAFT_59272 [Aspergillus tamarii]